MEVYMQTELNSRATGYKFDVGTIKTIGRDKPKSCKLFSVYLKTDQPI